MLAVLPLLSLALCGPSHAAWVETGPERGHVLDAAVCSDAIYVATRVGVERADVGLGAWSRDPRFPPEVRRLACGEGGVVFAAPAGQVWRVGAQTELIRFFETRTDPVDLAVSGGALLVALRGEEAGILRVADGAPVRVLEGVDPWCLAAHGDDVLLGTVSSGAFLSRDAGESFTPLLEGGGVSAVAWVGKDAWIALPDGALWRWQDGDLTELPAVRNGYVSGIAPWPDGALLTTQRRGWGQDSLFVWNGSTLRGWMAEGTDSDGSAVDLTGLWPRPDGTVLVGDFRRGPLLIEGGRLRPARTGFRATVTGGAALDGRGRLVLALMGTGVYVSADAATTWQTIEGQDKPVTDSVEVVPWGEGVLVVDFEGITGLDAEGRWSRLPRVEALRPGEHLVSAAADGAGRLWALDRQGGLHLLEGDTWRTCTQRGLRLDGHGAALLLAGHDGFYAPTSCVAAWEPVSLDEVAPLDPRRARADGGWIAAPGVLWREGKARFALPALGVTAVAAVGEEALVGFEDGQVLRCGESCTALDPAPGAIRALGRFADGRVWAAEQGGTLLVQGEGVAPTPWTDLVGARRVTGDLLPLERAPWDDEAGPAQPQGPAPPAKAMPAAPAPVAADRRCGCASGRPGGVTSLGIAGLLLASWCGLVRSRCSPRPRTPPRAPLDPPLHPPRRSAPRG